jgi:hypothetical protein
MVLDIFFRKPNRRAGGSVEDLDRVIAAIESFAPRQYKKERELYYYNYRMVAAYRGPLMLLLESLCQEKAFSNDESAFGREIFLRLKDFYDVKNTLPEVKALADPSLRRKFQDLFRFFFGKKGRWPSEI